MVRVFCGTSFQWDGFSVGRIYRGPIFRYEFTGYEFAGDEFAGYRIGPVAYLVSKLGSASFFALRAALNMW